MNSSCSSYCSCNCNNCKSDAHLRGRQLRHEQSRDPIHKQHLLCFPCRRAWKQPFVIHPDAYYIPATEEERIAYTNWKAEGKDSKCSQCGTRATYVGPDCRAPPHRDVKGWKKLAQMIANGATFSSCRQQRLLQLERLRRTKLLQKGVRDVPYSTKFNKAYDLGKQRPKPIPAPTESDDWGLIYNAAEGVWEFN